LFIDELSTVNRELIVFSLDFSPEENAPLQEQSRKIFSGISDAHDAGGFLR
jgi:hypothetical protein